MVKLFGVVSALLLIGAVVYGNDNRAVSQVGAGACCTRAAKYEAEARVKVAKDAAKASTRAAEVEAGLCCIKSAKDAAKALAKAAKR